VVLRLKTWEKTATRRYHMRKIIGAGALVLGVLGLVYVVSVANATRLGEAVKAAAAEVVAQSVHGVAAAVDGRDIAVSGLADSAAERDGLLAALQGIDGVGTVSGEIEVLEAADPYAFAATRKEGRVLVQGNVPTEAERARLGGSGVEGLDGLVLASGAPAGWSAAVDASLAALNDLSEGAVSFQGTQVTLTGLAETPAQVERVLAAFVLPDGYSLKDDIEARDDGEPVAFEISYDASAGGAVTGKVPSDLSAEAIAEAMGVAVKEAEEGALATGLVGDLNGTLEVLAQLRPWLPEFETLVFAGGLDGAAITAAVVPGADAGSIGAALGAQLGAGVTVVVTQTAQRPAAETQRENAATGEMERFVNGYWVPVYRFAPALPECRSQTAAVLERAQISFKSGTTEFVARSQRSITALAGVLARCMVGAGLTAELGGHTDNTGRNRFELSAERAVVARAALAARGVPAAALSVAGYGDSTQVAGNDTAEGRAANNRISIIWRE
jgi:outer membrane protein OmpA-like peptidoglycan-associated protein